LSAHPYPTTAERVLALGLPAAALASAASASNAVLTRRVGLEALLGGPRLHALEASLLLALGLGAAVLVAAWNDWRSRGPARAARPALGAAVVGAIAGWQTFLLAVQPFQRVWFDAALVLLCGIWAGGVLWLRRPRQPSRLRRALGLTAVGAALTVAAAELGLRAAGSLAPSALLARSGEAPRKLIERFRCRPGLGRFGFPCNSSGYYDEEFYRTRPGERAVCSIGDSFNLGSVPHARHFTTVCEGELGLAVHNLGVAGIGPREYLALLLDEALPLAPDAVVVGLFVGNDLDVADVGRDLPDAGLRAWLQRERVLTWVLPRRLARVARECKRLGNRRREVAIVQGERAVAERFPWLDEPALEEGTLSPESFDCLETQRALAVCARSPVSLTTVFESLAAMHEACGEIPFGVMLIPDEFQVSDALWARVVAAAGVPLERDRPQRLLRAWLEEADIPYLDLLEKLRAVSPAADGQRHLYHLRDTHFNARGNDVAGRALARFFAALLDA
jgi:hypothetical protein